MDKLLTRRHLSALFMVSSGAICCALLLAGWLAYGAMRNQHSQLRFALAFTELENALDRLQAEFGMDDEPEAEHEPLHAEHEPFHADHIVAAVPPLLRPLAALRHAESDDAKAAQTSVIDTALATLFAAHGVDPAREAALRGLRSSGLPRLIETIWEGDGPDDDDASAEASGMGADGADATGVERVDAAPPDAHPVDLAIAKALATHRVEAVVVALALGAAAVAQDIEATGTAQETRVAGLRRLLAHDVHALVAAGPERLRSAFEDSAVEVQAWLSVVVGVGVATVLANLFALLLPLQRRMLSLQGDLLRQKDAALAGARAKSDFLATMSHEIRTPMNGVVGMAALLERTRLDDRQRLFTDTISRSARTLLTVINDVLDASKIEAGHMRLKAAPFAARRIVLEPVDMLAPAAAAKGVELLARVRPDVPEALTGDSDRLRQVVTNLLGNAVKFTETGQIAVDMSTRPDDSGGVRLRITVRDTGPGIAPDKLDTVFDKFSQVDQTATRRHEGTGLGLAISEGLVGLMGGRIGVESQLGEGSTFWFEVTLPVAASAQVASRPGVQVAGRRALVVDDNATNRLILQELLGAWRIAERSAATGPEALGAVRRAAAEGAPFDIAILDHHMPGMSGLDVLEALRADPATASMPVVLLSSVDDIAMREAQTGDRFLRCLLKPVHASRLFDAVIDLLADSGETAPKPAETPDPGPARPTLAVAAAPGDRIDVLVVDDNEINRMVAGQLLHEAGWRFDFAEDGASVPRLMRRLRPRMVLMDVSMPEVDGHEATRRLRAEEARQGLPRTPVIGLTANAMTGDREACLAAGMDDYLAKPIDYDDLQRMVSRWLTAADGVATRVGRANR